MLDGIERFGEAASIAPWTRLVLTVRNEESYFSRIKPSIREREERESFLSLWPSCVIVEICC